MPRGVRGTSSPTAPERPAMPEDPYAVETTGSEGAEANGDMMDHGPEGGRTKDGETALLPRTIFSGKELTPGSKCTFEVVKVYEDEVEVKYVKEENPRPSMSALLQGLEGVAKPYGGM